MTALLQSKTSKRRHPFVVCTPSSATQFKSLIPITDTPPLPIENGFSRCGKCNCRGFEGSSQTCANSGCGHAYSDHY